MINTKYDMSDINKKMYTNTGPLAFNFFLLNTFNAIKLPYKPKKKYNWWKKIKLFIFFLFSLMNCFHLENIN
jgi:hypothetical protein